MNALKVNSGKKFINIIGNYMWCHFKSTLFLPWSRQLVDRKWEFYKIRSKGVLHLTYFDLHSSICLAFSWV